ncbi:MAG: hypothetical protein HC899_33870 [Leptolyngbyaceae cyanobacterium SM1_4_3]|nr:hypothetical protein [Leptolyngbyaceae cyanobacterium SM1_4_3]
MHVRLTTIAISFIIVNDRSCYESTAIAPSSHKSIDSLQQECMPQIGEQTIKKLNHQVIMLMSRVRHDYRMAIALGSALHVLVG